MDSAASIATTLFTDLPFSGEVNFLTTGGLAPGAAVAPKALAFGMKVQAYDPFAKPGAFKAAGVTGIKGRGKLQ